MIFFVDDFFDVYSHWLWTFIFLFLFLFFFATGESDKLQNIKYEFLM